MSRPSEYWSEEHAHSSGKPDANLATNALQLGGIDAEDYATKKYVQDFHNNKEELLKEYIDSQDLAKLQEAKDYVDTMIRNQDFSSFAKLTDLQYLSQTLSARIEACKTECQQEMNTKINAVVSDVNSNFDDVNGAIDTLNTRTNELFTSVSNGKEVVAAAITDKGVQTASDATYNTMANNIRQIETGSIDTSDATATEYDIVLGKTAYGKDKKMSGLLIPPTDYPTYGTDTSNANASAEDIALGKSVYANGQYIVGTANPSVNPEVEEIYGTSANDYNIEDANIGLTTYPDTTDKVVSRTNITFSKDGKYCVSVVKLNDVNSSEYYIESHPVNKNGLIIEASADENNETIYKKYRYTRAELNIDDDEYVIDIKIGSPGFLKYSTRCLLLIATSKKIVQSENVSYEYYYHLYTYHLNDNGVIGKECNGSKFEIQGYKEKISTIGRAIVFSNTNPTVFFRIIKNSNYISISKSEVNYIANTDGSLNVKFILGTFKEFVTDYGDAGFKDTDITTDDKYIFSSASDSSSEANGFVIELDNNLIPIKCYKPNGGNLANSGCGIVEDTEQLLVWENSSFKLYDKTISWWNLNKTIKFGYKDSSSHYAQGNMIITTDQSKVILVTSERVGSGDYRNNKTLRLAVFNMDDILNANNNDSVMPIQYFNLIFNGQNFSTTKDLFEIKSNSDGTVIFIYVNSNNSEYKAQLWTLWAESNNQLLGIRYKNQFFRSIKPQLLSAIASDVASGKTFIGYDGSVQTGTLT